MLAAEGQRHSRCDEYFELRRLCDELLDDPACRGELLKVVDDKQEFFVLQVRLESLEYRNAGHFRDAKCACNHRGNQAGVRDRRQVHEE